MAQEVFLATGNNTLAYSAAANGTLTGIGAVRYTTGFTAGQQALFAEESTTNRITNPGFEVDLTGWALTNETGITSTAVRDTTTKYQGLASYRVDVTANTGAVNVRSRNLMTVTGNTASTVTASAMVRTSNTNLVPVLYMDCKNASSVLVGSSFSDNTSASVPATNTWYKIETTAVCSSTPASISFYLMVYNKASGALGSVWFDNVQCEDKTYSTTYCDGSLGTGYSWAGTAHASVSSRTADRYELASSTGVTANDRGEVFFKFLQTSAQAGGAAGIGWAYRIGTGGDSAIVIGRNMSGNIVAQFEEPSANGGTLSQIISASTVPNGWHTISVFYSTSVRGISIDGVIDTQQTGTYPSLNFTGKLFALGSNISSVGAINTAVGPWMVYSEIQNRPTRLALAGNSLWTYGMSLPQGTGTSAFLVGV